MNASTCCDSVNLQVYARSSNSFKKSSNMSARPEKYGARLDRGEGMAAGPVRGANGWW